MKFILKFLPVFLATILPLASCTEDPEDAMGTIVGFVTQAHNYPPNLLIIKLL